MNTIWAPGKPGAGVDSAFPEQLVIISKVSTAISARIFGMNSGATITQIGIR
jgi:hypothetical protein